MQQQILQVLSYFDMFSYPLLAAEIREYMPLPVSKQVLQQELDDMQQQELVYKLDDFYAVQDDIFMATRRNNGNRCAAAELKKAAKAARVLYRFPFVNGLAISGSLSKNYADENSDIDFFIITAPNRLWIARTLMHIFYKWAVFTGRSRMFCMNYYVDETALHIPEENIFTAMEIVTLLPAAGLDCIENFTNANNWVKDYFPAAAAKTPILSKTKKGWIRVLAEKILSGNLGNLLDNWLLRLTRKHWRQKKQQQKKNTKGICTGMLADKHFAKPNPVNFQQKILVSYDQKLQQLNRKVHHSIVSPTSSFSFAVK